MLNLCIFSGQNTNHLFELFIWMLGSFLIGWFLNRYFSKSKYQTAIDDCEARCKDLEQKNVDLTASISSKSTPEVSSITNTETSSKTSVSSLAAVSTTDDKVKDNLKKVEGIGPKIQEHLNNDGIWSFAQLAASSIERLQKVLDNAGPHYRMHNPKTWPKQAALARDGKWDELKKWQDELNGGL